MHKNTQDSDFDEDQKYSNFYAVNQQQENFGGNPMNNYLDSQQFQPGNPFRPHNIKTWNHLQSNFDPADESQFRQYEQQSLQQLQQKSAMEMKNQKHHRLETKGRKGDLDSHEHQIKYQHQSIGYQDGTINHKKVSQSNIGYEAAHQPYVHQQSYQKAQHNPRRFANQSTPEKSNQFLNDQSQAARQQFWDYSSSNGQACAAKDNMMQGSNHGKHYRKVQQPAHLSSVSANSESSYYSHSNVSQNQQQLFHGSAPRHSPYSQYYPNLVVSLYYGKGDGEIFLVNDEATGKSKMVTCIDISTLYQEKRGSAVQMIQTLASFRHKNIVTIEKYWIVPNYLLFVEMEAPDPIAQWKSFCKQNFTSDQILSILNQIVEALDYLHSEHYIHRDVHPSRIQQFEGGVVKFNTVGLPYTFKKLLKRSDFSGHVNYSAPELILEKSVFSEKIDIWALGCCIYYIFNKCDPFEGKDPQVIKHKILNFNMKQAGQTEDGLDAKTTAIRQLIQACLNYQDMIRPSCAQLLQTIAKAQSDQKTSNSSKRPQGQVSGQQPTSKPDESSCLESLLSSSVPNESSLNLAQAINENTPRINSIKRIFNNSVKFSSSGDVLQVPKPNQTQQIIQLDYLNQAPQCKQEIDDNQSAPEQVKFKVSDQLRNLHAQEHELDEEDSVAGQIAQALARQSLNEDDESKHNSIFFSMQDQQTSNNASQSPEKITHQIFSSDLQVKQQAIVAEKLADIQEYKETEELLAELRTQIDSEKMHIASNVMPQVTYKIEIEQINNQTQLMQQDFTQIFSQVQLKMKRSKHYTKLFESCGRSFEGEVIDGKKHGVGILFTEHGETYAGFWDNNVKKGFGRYTFSNGDIYVGTFDNDKPNGHGKMDFYLSGNVYEGQWKDGKGTGQGLLNQTSDQKVLKGEFWDCDLHGFGQIHSRYFKHVGEFRHGEQDGFGKLEDMEQLQRYVGMFKQGKMDGQGVLMDQKNAILFSGQWKEGKKHGNGKQINFAADQTISGAWQNDMLTFVECFGKITTADMALKTNLEQDSLKGRQ